MRLTLLRIAPIARAAEALLPAVRECINPVEAVCRYPNKQTCCRHDRHGREPHGDGDSRWVCEEGVRVRGGAMRFVTVSADRLSPLQVAVRVARHITTCFGQGGDRRDDRRGTPGQPGGLFRLKACRRQGALVLGSFPLRFGFMLPTVDPNQTGYSRFQRAASSPSSPVSCVGYR